jgi:hypothetical protein
MSTTTATKILSAPETVAGEAPAVFAPSEELGEQLQRLEQAQAEIDRRKAEELARLRALQDRD